MSKSIELNSGELTFLVPQKDGIRKEWRVDLITAKLIAENIERKHDLREEDGRLVPTRDFLDELVAEYEALGDCQVVITPTAARSIWVVIAYRFLDLSAETDKHKK